MQTLSTVPEQVDIACYGGDTLTIEVILEAGFADGATWTAQVRSTTDATDVGAQFTVQMPAAPGDPAYLTLTGEQTAALAAAGTQQVANRGGSACVVNGYTGVWDVQVSDAGADPITTLAHGTITVEQDVTRGVAP